MRLGLGLGLGGSGGSAGSQQSPDAELKTPAPPCLGQIASYQATAHRARPSPARSSCLEAADRTLGGQVHAYANLLAVGHGFTAPQSDLTAARNEAQTLANSLEILGDAQPTQANYNQVLNTFNVERGHRPDAARGTHGLNGATGG